MFLSLFTAIVKFKPARVIYNVYKKPGLDLYPRIFNIYKFYNLSTTPIRLKIDFKALSGVDKSKAEIILSLNFKSADDCLPFYKLPITKLIKIQKITNDDKKRKFCDNRLYYISSKLQCAPALVSEKLACRTFVYDLSFEWLQKSLDTLLEKGVSGDRILRDMWVLKYNHKTIRDRLQKIKDMGVDVLYPWMVRCTPDILEKYVTLTRETKNILGEGGSPQMYLAKRLNISMDAVDEMLDKVPALRTIRVTKVKKFLDFLMDEGFSEDDISDKPRVLASSQKTIKYRLYKLRNLGYKDINLNSLCKTRKNFQKYYESLEMLLKDNKDNMNQTASKIDGKKSYLNNK